MADRTRAACHIAAAVLIAIVFIDGIALTRSLEWPVGPDTFRDIAAAQSITQSIGRSLRRGVPLADPYYRGEAFWYNPMLPGVLALLSNVFQAPIHIVAARAPAYLNLATPITFYLLAVALFDPPIALAALAGFLFVEPFNAREAATYSPWLIVSNFAQAFFYATLLLWLRYRSRPRLSLAVLIGALAGTALMAHTAPAALLALVCGVDTLLLFGRRWREGPGTERLLGLTIMMIATALVVSIPVLVTPLHYHGQIREPLPFLYLDPQMAPENLPEFLVSNLTQYTFVVPALVGLAALATIPGEGGRLSLIWLLTSLSCSSGRLTHGAWSMLKRSAG